MRIAVNLVLITDTTMNRLVNLIHNIDRAMSITFNLLQIKAVQHRAEQSI